MKLRIFSCTLAGGTNFKSWFFYLGKGCCGLGRATIKRRRKIIKEFSGALGLTKGLHVDVCIYMLLLNVYL